MDRLRHLESFSAFLDVADIYGISVSAILTILAVGGVVLGSALAFRWRTHKGSDSKAPLYVQARIDEVRDAIRAQKAIALTTGIANTFLVFGQIVIGGTLASTFLQENINKNVTGALGVLVLISSLVHQQFRPDLVRRGARRRIVRLGAILRDAEDSVYYIERGNKDAEDISLVRKRVSEGLTMIEKSEVEEMSGQGPITSAVSRAKAVASGDPGGSSTSSTDTAPPKGG